MIPLIYYVTRADRPGQVKIGLTRNMESRLAALRRVDGLSHEVTLLAVEVGGREVERMRHASFAPMRLDGEWFTLGAPIIHYVMELDQIPVVATNETHRAPAGA